MADTQPVIILVNPQMGENIGAAARAMLNGGLKTLRLVAPRDGWPNEKADAMSAGAMEHITIELYETTADAIADCHTVYSTAAWQRDMVKPILTPKASVAEISAKLNEGQRTAILFGPERSGLLNEDVLRSNAMISIPLNPEFSSLNLGQAVLVIAYEWSQLAYAAPDRTLPTGKSLPATASQFDNFCTRLQALLEEKHFFRVEEMKYIMMGNIRNLFVRAEATDQELNTLHGIFSALLGKKKPPGEF